MSSQDSGTDQSDLQFCWDQVLRVRPQFRLTHPYARRTISTGLLATHALLSALEEAVSGVSAEEVSRAKLAWWQQELLEVGVSGSRHPILRVLERSSCNPDRMHQHLRSMLNLSLQRIEADTVADERVLQRLCRELGLQQMRLEFALDPDESAAEDAQAHSCIASGFLQILRESVRQGPDRAFWWLPLNLLARFGLSRTEFTNGGVHPASMNLMRAVFSGVLGAGSGASNSNDGAGMAHVRIGSAPQGPRHWFVQSALQLRLLARLEVARPQRYPGILSTTHFSDAWFAWRAARQWRG